MKNRLWSLVIVFLICPRAGFGDGNADAQGIPSKWKACAGDNDCTAAVADCVTWDAVNKKYLKKLAKDLRSCSESIDPGFQPEAACVDKMCQTTQRSTNVSWEEWFGKMNPPAGEASKERGQ